MATWVGADGAVLRIGSRVSSDPGYPPVRYGNINSEWFSPNGTSHPSVLWDNGDSGASFASLLWASSVDPAHFRLPDGTGALALTIRATGIRVTNTGDTLAWVRVAMRLYVAGKLRGTLAQTINVAADPATTISFSSGLEATVKAIDLPRGPLSADLAIEASKEWAGAYMVVEGVAAASGQLAEVAGGTTVQARTAIQVVS